MKKRVILLCLALAALVALAAGAAMAESKIQLRWFLRWDPTRVQTVATPVEKDYEASHPNIDIVVESPTSSANEYWTRLQTMVAGGSPPDVLYPATYMAQILAQNNQLLDLSSLMKYMDTRAYDRRILSLYKYGNKVIGLPIDRAALVLFYNQDLFDKAGVAYPKDNMTWEELIQLAKKLTKDTNGDGRNDQWGMHLDSDIYWQVVLYHLTGKNVFDDLAKPTKFLLKDPKAIQALQFYADMINKDRIAARPSERANQSDTFPAGNTAMILNGHWRVPTYLPLKFKWNCVTIPTGKFKANRADGSCFSIAKGSKHPKEAWEFVKYLAGTNGAGVKKLLEAQQMVPALTALQSSDLFLKAPDGNPGLNKKAFLAFGNNLISCYQPMNTTYDLVRNTLNTEFNKLWEGQITAAEAVKNVTPAIEKIINEYNAGI